MNTENVVLFNIGEVVKSPAIAGAGRLNRFPESLETQYQLPGGKMVTRSSTGCEVRFVPECDQFVIHISATDHAKVHWYQGDFWSGVQEMEPGKQYAFAGERKRNLCELREPAKSQCKFSPEVMRFNVERGSVTVHHLDTYGFPYRKPTHDEQPSQRWLAYGSSITQCDTYGYIHQAAARLEVDVLNKGMSGSCGVEEATARFLSEECDWDFATLEWGVNMRNSVEPEEFQHRVDAALPHFLKSGKPVALITPFPNDCHLEMGEPEAARRQAAYADILRKTHETLATQHPQLHLIEGADVLKSYHWLVGDLVHPSHQGHSLMGEQLAQLLRPITVN